MTNLTTRDEALTIRPLGRDDLAGVVAIDAALGGQPRSDYVERRLAASLREPALHAQFAACDQEGLAGYILARVLEGEFGRTEPGLRLEMVGVRAGARGQRVGARLFEVLAGWAQRHGIREIHTTCAWRDASMLHWLDTVGFSLAPVFVLDVSVAEASRRPQRGEQVTITRGHGPAAEVDFGDTEANDDERMAAQRPEVRAMRAEDLSEIVRIDRGMTGRDRHAYIAARLAEAMDDSGIRVSLAARVNGAIAGYVMARADLGDCGRTQPVAMLDTLGVAVNHWRSGIGRALLDQLFDNLAALRIERAETVVAADDLALLGFFGHMGFRPAQRLSFSRRLDQAG